MPSRAQETATSPAIIEYRDCPDTPVVVIAAMRSEKAKTKGDFGCQKHGRETATVPSDRQLKILKATKTKTYQEVGAEFDVSKQRVGQIARRWKHYLPVRVLRVQAPVGGDRGNETAKKKETRIRVISFRLSLTEVQLLRQRYPEVKSVSQAARGIVAAVLSI